jgi:crotonobetainyl-CoA:carnitine CoA-transferase CaiB-like acyl-CoA transferase
MRKPFETRDGYIGLLPYTEAQWNGFFEAAGWGESFARDPRFADHASRNRNIRALYELIGEATKTKTTAEWFALLKPLSIPVVKLNTLDELEDDPHLQAVGLFEHYEHPHAGPYVAVRPAVRFAASPASIRRHAPRLGEHTDEVLAELAAEPER